MILFSDLSGLLLTPVHFAIDALFILALVESGRMLVQWVMRVRGRTHFRGLGSSTAQSLGSGYPIASLYFAAPRPSADDLDVEALKRLEIIRVATRVTPMLGLIATLIPMGPALLALTKNDVAQMAELLRSAFSAVVLALAASVLCFWIATVRRRWCAEEVLAVRRLLEVRS
jgi:biopolymer transport protein ExbB/TolQ